ncbi:hypothetical protein J2Y55_003714 [Bosea sp. BE125]|uniref:hypothetical protein n=1 Tax=Bosea sp. BE125 TaxID=2817909 RepID=UPI00285D4462|nr:hypothetical protein [Bosea sp. BE125]MDR6872695.1 hypothetical protein [Bosea sp. BE125]
MKRMLWDRPEGSRMHNRQGDREDTPIYTALGKAVSAWEGVNAAVASLFHALHAGDEQEVDAFGGVFKVHDRANALREECARFLDADFGDQRDQAAKLKKSMRQVAGAYCEWAVRRNELAHGYVTEARCPDYGDDEQPIITVYALLPSHARLGAWSHAEPRFNYLAADIELFAQRFRELDARIEGIAKVAAELYRFRSPKLGF